MRLSAQNVGGLQTVVNFPWGWSNAEHVLLTLCKRYSHALQQRIPVAHGTDHAHSLARHFPLGGCIRSSNGAPQRSLGRGIWPLLFAEGLVEGIANVAYGANRIALAALRQLLAQAPHMHVNCTLVDLGRLPPHAVQRRMGAARVGTYLSGVMTTNLDHNRRVAPHASTMTSASGCHPLLPGPSKSGRLTSGSAGGLHAR